MATALAAAVLSCATPVAATDVAPATTPATSPATAPVTSPVASAVATEVTATWSGVNVKLGGASSVKGTVGGAAGGAPRTVNLDQYLASGWRTLRATTSSVGGAYTFTVPTDSYRRARLSVSSTAVGAAAAGRSAAQATTVVPAYTPAGSWTSWAPFSPSTRYRLDPCRPVGYRVNLALAPSGALADVKEAVVRVHRASGITFRYLGSTRALPPSMTGWPTDATLVIGWARPSQTTWNMSGNTLGFGGIVRWRSAVDARGDLRRIAQGGVLIDSTERLGTGFSAGNRRGKLLLHEIGHAVGLGHVASTSQRMNSFIDRTSPARWGRGDLAGFGALGLAGGCVADRG